MRLPVWATVLAIGLFSPAQGLELSKYELVDLTHAYSEETLYWPTSPSHFELKELAYGETEGGWFYSAYSLCTPEHGGTHLDAPLHFAAGGLASDQLPLSSLIAPGVVIDVSDKAAGNPDYRLTLDDVQSFEARYGRISSGAVVLMRTDWSKFWPDAKSYLGDDRPGDASRLHFPSFGADAARWLVEERQVALLGVDTASIDYGASRDFPVHRIAAAADVGGLENLRDLDQLPPVGFSVLALPMKIQGGSGGPARVVALVEKTASRTGTD